MANPVVAVGNSTSSNPGANASIADQIRNNSWVDPGLPVADNLGLLNVALDPLGSLLNWAGAQGAGWLLSWLQPLNEPLDALAGSPDAVSAHSQSWTNAAQVTNQTRQQYANAVNSDTTDWQGATAEAYQQRVAQQATVLSGIGQSAGGITAAAAGAGLLVAGARSAVADLLAQLANNLGLRLPYWLAAEGVTADMATPGIVAQVAELVTACVNKIKDVLQALLNSMRRLVPMLGRLRDELTDLEQLSQKLARTHPHLAADGPTPGPLKFAMGKKKDDDISKWLGPRRDNEHECNSNSKVRTGDGYSVQCSICGDEQWYVVDGD